MSRDGLLPPVFQKIHPKHKTPSFSTLVTGLVVGLPILFTDKTFVLDFTSIATLFAFVLVCGGILLIPKRAKEPGKFHMPYVNGKIMYPLLIAGTIALLWFKAPNYFKNLFNFKLHTETETDITHSFISDKLADFKATHLLNKQDYIYLKKRFTNDVQKNSMQHIMDNNRTILNYFDSTAYALVTTHKNYNTGDTTMFSLPNNSININHLFTNNTFNKELNIKAIAGALDPVKDSALIAKCQQQQSVIDCYILKDSSSSLARNYVQQQVNNAFSNISMQSIIKEREKKLEAQHIFNISSIIFWGICILLSIIGLRKNYSLIPLLGLTACMYLLTGMSMNNWVWFLGWLALGLVLYALYGFKKSKLAKQ
jgi:hypothetical protein